MSLEYCEDCDRMIDLDVDEHYEHFSDDEKIIGIAKIDLEKGEKFKVPINLLTNEILENKYINFIEGTKLKDLKGGENGNKHENN